MIINRKYLLIILFLSILLLIGRSLYLANPDIIMDDAYISFRYALNLSSGNGLVFNPGERVEGYTNFLWTVILAGVHSIGLDMVAWSQFLAGLAAIGILVLLYFLSQRLLNVENYRNRYTFLAGIPMLLFGLQGSQARYVVSGMETLFFTFLVTLSIFLILRIQRPVLTGLVFALTAMTRPEGLLYFAISVGYVLLSSRSAFSDHPNNQSKWKYVTLLMGSFLFIYGGYFLWRFNYYGYLLPNTFYAKASSFSLARLSRGLMVLREITEWWGILPLLLLASFSLFSKRFRHVWILFFGLIFSTAAYFVAVGGDFIVWFGPRFFLPVLPFFLLLVAKGLINLFRCFRVEGKAFQGIQAVTIGVLCVYVAWFSWPARFDRLIGFAVQMRGWKETGQWMAAHLPTQTVIATDAAGLIPYYSGMRTIDMFGLTEERIAHLPIKGDVIGTIAHEKYDPEYVLFDRNPDCIVSTWINDGGQPVSAGLDRVSAEIQKSYDLVALAKIKSGPPSDGKWLLTNPIYSIDLYNRGYQTGVFCRKGYPVH